MAHTEAAIREAVELSAWVVGVVGIVLQLLACTAELLRRRHPSAGLVHLADRLVPGVGRRLAVGTFTAIAAVVAVAAPSRVASATTSSPVTTTDPGVGDRETLRAWLVGPDTMSPQPVRGQSPTTATSGPHAVPTTSTTTAISAVTNEPVAAPRPRVAPVAGPLPTATRPHDTATPAPVASATYTVVAGDCLWSIARQQLGPVVSDRAVDVGWRAIYAANAAAIGTDPNLIHPGLVVVLPPLDPTP